MFILWGDRKSITPFYSWPTGKIIISKLIDWNWRVISRCVNYLLQSLISAERCARHVSWDGLQPGLRLDHLQNGVLGCLTAGTHTMLQILPARLKHPDIFLKPMSDELHSFLDLWSWLVIECWSKIKSPKLLLDKHTVAVIAKDTASYELCRLCSWVNYQFTQVVYCREFFFIVKIGKFCSYIHTAVNFFLEKKLDFFFQDLKKLINRKKLVCLILKKLLSTVTTVLPAFFIVHRTYTRGKFNLAQRIKVICFSIKN